MTVELVYIDSHHQFLIQLALPRKSDIQAAINASKILLSRFGIDLSIHQVGVFGRVLRLDHKLDDGDRVEIYRPIIINPKEARRRRAKKAVFQADDN